MKPLWKSCVFSGLFFIPLAVSVSEFRGCDGAGKPATANSSNRQAATATINNTVITESEIRVEAAAELESLELRKLRDAASYARTEHEAMMGALERVLEEKLLALEAVEQDISIEQLIEREINRKITDPTEEEIDRVYELNRARVNRPKKDVEEQIREFLRERNEKEVRDAFLRQLEQKHKVVRNLEPFRFDVKTDGRPSLGPNDAPVKLVMFSDFECPYCRDLNDTLMEIALEYGDRIQIVFRQFPLISIHANAQRAAEASLCAHDQRRFMEVHNILYENQHELTEKNILEKIRPLELDMEKFRECLTSGRHKPEIREDIRAGAAVGADSTPTLFINGIYLSGGQPYGTIAAIINRELANID